MSGLGVSESSERSERDFIFILCDESLFYGISCITALDGFHLSHVPDYRSRIGFPALEERMGDIPRHHTLETGI